MLKNILKVSILEVVYGNKQLYFNKFLHLFLPIFCFLQERLSSLILNYVESGYLVTVTKKFVSNRDCEDTMFRVESYNLQTTGGLFILLVCGFALSLMSLVLEHAAFKYLVPYLRKQAADSRWKSRRTLEFFNQVGEFSNCLEHVGFSVRLKSLMLSGNCIFVVWFYM